jgi:hypothetical protein
VRTYASERRESHQVPAVRLDRSRAGETDRGEASEAAQAKGETRMSLGIASLAGGVGTGGAGGGSYSAASGDIRQTTRQDGTTGAGNRGFNQNIAFPGAILDADQGINGAGQSMPWWQWGVIIGGGIVGLVLLKKYVL